MLLEAEIAFLTWAADKLFSLARNDAERAAAARARVAAYFDDVAACLHEMSSGIAEGVIPRRAGHQLEVLIECFELTMASNFYGDHQLKGKEGSKFLQELRSLAGDARVADIHIQRGKVAVSGMKQDKAVEALQRACGRCRGLASMLRAIGPFKAQKHAG